MRTSGTIARHWEPDVDPAAADARRERITAKAEADAELNGCAGASDGLQGG
jgi:hypothetical protein